MVNKRHPFVTGHPFLLQLVTTFKDTNYLYMLMELCQGGELFLRLLEEQVLSEDQTQFYAGCIVRPPQYTRILIVESLDSCDSPSLVSLSITLNS